MTREELITKIDKEIEKVASNSRRDRKEFKAINKRFTIMGINDDTDTCALCGKTHLKKVVWVMDREIEEVMSVGSVCINKILGISLKMEDYQELNRRNYLDFLIIYRRFLKATHNESDSIEQVLNTVYELNQNFRKYSI